jgi:hypothetical protein
VGAVIKQVLRFPSPSPHKDADRESGSRGADLTAGISGVDEAAHSEDIRAADSSAIGDSMDCGDGAEPTRGPLQNGESTGGRELVEMAPRWVSHIRRQANIRGTAPEAAEAYIAELAGSSANIVKAYDQWYGHCKGLGVDPVSASDDAILSAVDAYAHSLKQNQSVKYSVYNARLRIVSNIYKYTRKLDVNTKIVQDARRKLTKSSTRGAQRVTTRSFNSGSVFDALVQFGKEAHFGISTDDEEIYKRRKLTFCLRTDGCSRADDVTHLLWNFDCIQPITKHGIKMELTPDTLRRCHTFRIAYQGSKTTGTRLTTSCTINRARSANTTDHKLKDTANALADYMEITAERRKQLHPHDKGHVLISSTKCQRRAPTTRFDQVQNKKVKYHWPCGGKCGQYHSLSPDRVAKDTVWCLETAQVDTKEFKSHQSRGNAETVVIYPSRFSNEFDASEARVRARHSEVTQNKYYLRPPDTAFMAKVVRLRQNVRRKMYPEELLRLS